VNSWLCCGYSVVKNKNLVLLISETARWTTTLRPRRKPGWSRTQTRTLLVSLLIKGGDVRICFITGRECPSVYHFRVRADNSLPEYLIVNNKQMAEPSTATQQNNISTKDSRDHEQAPWIPEAALCSDISISSSHHVHRSERGGEQC